MTPSRRRRAWQRRALASLGRRLDGIPTWMVATCGLVVGVGTAVVLATVAVAAWLLTILVVIGMLGLLAASVAVARARLRAAMQPVDGRFARFRATIEPELLSRPRVHRFAQPPLLAGPGPEPAPLALGIVGSGPPVERSLACLKDQEIAPEPVHVGDAAEELLRQTSSGHVLLLEAGHLLAPAAVRAFGQALRLSPDALAVTCDHDELDGHGARVEPRVYPGPSPDLLLECDLSGAALCVRRDAALSALGQAPLESRSWRYDLLLRVAGADGAGHAHVPAMLVHRSPETHTDTDSAAECRAAQAGLAARGETHARVEALPDGRRRVRRALRGEPSVEAIVLFRDRPELLRRCVSSLLERSTYDRLGVRLVDNGSVEPETAALLDELSSRPGVRAMSAPGHFNFAALNNAAVADSDAEVVVFLNNDTEVISPGWAQEMLEHAQRPEVGAVAPLLLYADGSVQHAGAAIGISDYAGHPFAGLDPEQATPFGTAVDGTRNWLAVTAACLMVERGKLDAVGGFDEGFVVAGNDVDLGLRLTAAGHRSLCVPHVRMLHDESQSRGSHVDPGDYILSEERYGSFRTIGDPFYNPALTLSATTCVLRIRGE